jgi:hypothetical protein
MGHIQGVEKRRIIHIEYASLCPFKYEHIVHPRSSSLFYGEPHCLSYMSLSLVEDWSGGGPAGRDLVSWFRTYRYGSLSFIHLC